MTLEFKITDLNDTTKKMGTNILFCFHIIDTVANEGIRRYLKFDNSQINNDDF